MFKANALINKGVIGGFPPFVPMKYDEIIKNKRLTDFEDLKDLVIKNKIKHVNSNKKIKGENTQIWEH